MIEVTSKHIFYILVVLLVIIVLIILKSFHKQMIKNKNTIEGFFVETTTPATTIPTTTQPPLPLSSIRFGMIDNQIRLDKLITRLNNIQKNLVKMKIKNTPDTETNVRFY